MASPNGLITLGIRLGGIAVEIRWQGNGAILLGEVGERYIGFDFGDAVAENVLDDYARHITSSTRFVAPVVTGLLAHSAPVVADGLGSNNIEHRLEHLFLNSLLVSREMPRKRCFQSSIITVVQGGLKSGIAMLVYHNSQLVTFVEFAAVHYALGFVAVFLEHY